VTVIEGGTMFHTASGTTVAFSTTDGNIAATNQYLAYGYCSTGSVTMTIADSISTGGSQSWIVAQGPISVAAGEWYVWMVNSASACTAACVDTITVTASGTCTDLYGSVIEASGLTASGFDQGPDTQAGLSSGTATPTTTPQLIVGILSGGDGGTNAAAGTGYTLYGHSNSGARNPAIEAKVVTSCGSQTAVFTAATGTVQTSVLTFKGTGGSSCSASGHCASCDLSKLQAPTFIDRKPGFLMNKGETAKLDLVKRVYVDHMPAKFGNNLPQDLRAERVVHEDHRGFRRKLEQRRILLDDLCRNPQVSKILSCSRGEGRRELYSNQLSEVCLMSQDQGPSFPATEINERSVFGNILDSLAKYLRIDCLIPDTGGFVSGLYAQSS